MTDISYYLDQAYTKVLRRDDDGDIVATIAELDGCIAHGRDEAEALGNLREAQAAWLEAAITAGRDIPVPELEEDLPSGKLVLRLPRSLHLKLNKLAKKDDVSLNQLLVMAVTEHVSRREGRNELRATFAGAWGRPVPAKWSSRHSSAAQGGEYLQKLKEHGAVGVEEDHHHSSGRSPRMRRS
jgi:antitoxin HicB